MGISYSTVAGYGVVIPEELIEALNEKHKDDDEWEGVSEFFYYLGDEYDYLSIIESGSCYVDDGIEYAVVLKESERTSYGLGFQQLRSPIDTKMNYDLLNDELNKFFMEEFGVPLGDKQVTWLAGMLVS